MTQDCFATARQHRRHPAAPGGQHRVTDGVDAAMHRMQAPQRHAAIDRAAAEAESAQLRARYDPVLSRRQPCDPALIGRAQLGWARLTITMSANLAHVDHHANIGCQTRAGVPP